MNEKKLNNLLSKISRKKVGISIIFSISVIIGIIYTFFLVTPEYKSRATIILGDIQKNSEISNNQNDNIQNNYFNLITTYIEFSNSEDIMQEVAYKTNEKFDIKKISIARVGNSDLLEISAINENPSVSQKLVNNIIEVFSEHIKEIYKINDIYIIDKVRVDDKPCNINHILDISISIVCGIIFSTIYIIINLQKDKTIKNEKDVYETIRNKTLITIPKDKDNSSKLNIITPEVKDAFKALKTNIQFSNSMEKDVQTLLFTSCFDLEGKTYVATHVARTFAKDGKKVILIDANILDGRLAEIFNVENTNGLSNYISNIDSNGMEINWNLGEYIRKTDLKNLNLITSGSIPPNVDELLSSKKISNLIDLLKKYYDIIIFDGPSVFPVNSTLNLASIVKKVIIVVKTGKTQKESLLKAQNNLNEFNAKVIGVILNKASLRCSKINNKYYIKVKMKKTFKTKVCKKLKALKSSVFTKFSNIYKKLKTSKKRLTSGNKNEEKEIQKRIKVVKKEEKIRKSEELAREKSEKNKLDKLKKEEKKVNQKKIEEERVKREIEEKAKEDAIMAEEKEKIEKEEKLKKEKLRKEKEEEKNRKKEERKIKFSSFKNKISENYKKIKASVKNKKESILKYIADKKQEINDKALEKKKIKEEKKRIAIEEKNKQLEKKAEEKAKKEEELAKMREEERLRKEEEKRILAEEKYKKEEAAKYTDEYLEENLYPKTKFSKL